MSSLRKRVADSLSLPPSRRRTGSGRPPDPTCPQGQADGGSSSYSDEEAGWEMATSEAGKPWMRVDKKVYEEQLEKLQEQLVNAMLENQSLQG